MKYSKVYVDYFNSPMITDFIDSLSRGECIEEKFRNCKATVGITSDA